MTKWKYWVEKEAARHSYRVHIPCPYCEGDLNLPVHALDIEVESAARRFFLKKLFPTRCFWCGQTIYFTDFIQFVREDISFNEFIDLMYKAR